MERIWTNRRPGDVACPETDGPGGKPARNGTLLVGRFIGSTVFVVPADTPAPDRRGPHRYAGQTVKVTRRFYGPNPFTGSGRVAHLWSEEASLGVAECAEGFGVYHIDENTPTDALVEVESKGGIVIHGIDDLDENERIFNEWTPENDE